MSSDGARTADAAEPRSTPQGAVSGPAGNDKLKDLALAFIGNQALLHLPGALVKVEQGILRARVAVARDADGTGVERQFCAIGLLPLEVRVPANQNRLGDLIEGVTQVR